MAAELIAALEADAERMEISHSHGKTVWRAWGQGPALVLVHGGSGSWRHWARNIATLAGHCRVYAPDAPGFGESDELPDASIEQYGTILAQDIDAIGLPPHYVLAGFSLGAWIAAHMLAPHHDRVSRLVTVGMGGLGRMTSVTSRLHSWRQLATPEERNAVHRRNLEILMFARPESANDLAVEIQAYNSEMTRDRRRGRSESATIKTCLEAHPVRLTGIWGARDVLIEGYFEERREAMRAIDPDAGFHLVPDAGHWVQFEEPDAVNRLMLFAMADEPQTAGLQGVGT